MQDNNPPQIDFSSSAGPLILQKLKNTDRGLSILFSFADSPFGRLIIASTNKGICHLAFIDSQEEGLSGLKQIFPGARLHLEATPTHQQALHYFLSHPGPTGTMILHVKGTDFQIQVWSQLLHIPQGERSTYGAIAQQIGHPKAARAVGTAIGNNPVALLIPCHRVVKASGKTGGYRWGTSRKEALLNWEAALEGPHKPLKQSHP